VRVRRCGPRRGEATDVAPRVPVRARAAELARRSHRRDGRGDGRRDAAGRRGRAGGAPVLRRGGPHRGLVRGSEPRRRELSQGQPRVLQPREL
jgi:hypothetical protein